MFFTKQILEIYIVLNQATSDMPGKVAIKGLQKRLDRKFLCGMQIHKLTLDFVGRCCKKNVVQVVRI